MNHAGQRAAICQVGKSLFDRGYAHGTAGNISVRLPDGAGFLITPTDACLGFLEPEALAHVSLQGDHLGGGAASKTLALHRRIYGADESAQCVLHTHSTHLVALTLAGVWRPDAVLPPITPYAVMKVDRVPLIGYQRPGAPGVADAVAAQMRAARAAGAPIRAVLCERLGPVVWQRTPLLAMAVLEELEETAKLWLAHPQAAPLTDAQIDDLRQAFGAAW